MNTIDLLLIFWWPALLVNIVLGLILVRWIRQREREENTLAVLRGDIATLSMRTQFIPTDPVMKSVRVMFFVLLVAVMVGFAVLAWFRNETTLHVLSGYLLLTLMGAGLLAFAFAKEPPGISGNVFSLRGMWSYQPKPGSLGAKVMRTLYFALGCFLFYFASSTLVGDVLFPWHVVEGRVEKTEIYRGYSRRGWGYQPRVFIDGHRYDTTTEIYSGLQIGQRIRAEIGTGSDTIFRATPIR